MGFLDYHVAEDVYLALAKLQGGLAQGSLTGTTRWVDNSNSEAVDAKGKGSFYAPFNTADYAVGQCDAGKGDAILLMPGHAETTAVDVDLDVAGASIAGLMQGNKRPSLTFTDTAAAFIIGAAGCRVANLDLICDVDLQVDMMQVEAAGDGALIYGCLLRSTDASAKLPVDVIHVASATDVRIEGNHLSLYDGANTITIGIHDVGASPRLSVLNNRVIVNALTLAVQIGGAAASDDFLVIGNKIYQKASVVGGAITVTTASTGFIADNRGYCANASAVVSGGSAMCGENYFTNVLANSGTLDPAA